MNEDIIPEPIKHYFNCDKINFVVSIFEQYLLNDLYQSDEESLRKLSRNVTDDLITEIKQYIAEKRNIRYSCLGETRSGKSLSMLALVNFYCIQSGLLNFAEKIEYIVCGNQVEYREKLKDAKFGDFFLIDENFFTRSGMGANLEALQLKDYNNTIAKKNIGNIFITPETFLSVGAVLGFATYGRDSKNWLSRLLVYKFKGSHPYLVGFIVLDVGRLFMEHGCFLYKYISGCNNNNQIDLNDIPKDLIEHSFCIPKEYDESLLITDNQSCPFYKFCNHPLCRYERKKDKWIKSSISGALDNRTYERYKLSLELTFELIGSVDTDRNIIKYNCRNAKDMKNIVRIRIHKFTNTKLGIAEFDEILQIIISNSNIDFVIENLHTLKNEELKEKYFTHEEFGSHFKQKYDEYVASLPVEEDVEDTATQTESL